MKRKIDPRRISVHVLRAWPRYRVVETQPALMSQLVAFQGGARGPRWKITPNGQYLVCPGRGAAG